MHVLNDRIRNNSVENCARYIIFCTKMTGGIFSRTCYTKLNFDFPYVRSPLLRRDTYMSMATGGRKPVTLRSLVRRLSDWATKVKEN